LNLSFPALPINNVNANINKPTENYLTSNTKTSSEMSFPADAPQKSNLSILNISFPAVPVNSNNSTSTSNKIPPYLIPSSSSTTTSGYPIAPNPKSYYIIYSVIYYYLFVKYLYELDTNITAPYYPTGGPGTYNNSGGNFGYSATPSSQWSNVFFVIFLIILF
jgi:hypothetical protein